MRQNMHNNVRYSSIFGLILLGLQWLAPLAFAADRVFDATLISKEPALLTPYFSILEDPERNLTLSQVQRPDLAQRFKGEWPALESLGFGFTRSAYWVRLSVRNADEHSILRLLELSYPHYSKVELYQPDQNGVYQVTTLGNMLPFSSRPIPNRNFVFPLTLPAHSEQVLYLFLQSNDAMIIPIKLWDAKAFYVYERNDYFAQAWYFGLALGMILFNLLLYLALRDTAYLVYSTFVGLSMLTVAALNGMGKEFLWPNAGLWSDVAHFVLLSIAGGVIVQFLRLMLETKKRVPRLDKVLVVAMCGFVLQAILYAFSLQHTAWLIVFVDVVLGVVMVSVAVYCAFKRIRSSYFFLMAFSMLTMGALSVACRSMGWVSSNVFTVNGFQFGGAGEMLLLAFALADRFIEIRRKQGEAESDALRARADVLQAQNAALLAQAQAQAAQSETALAQSQLAQSEKMAALGQLVASVAHEINAPIGAVKLNGGNISDALGNALMNMPKLFQTLDDENVSRFLQLIENANSSAELLSSRQERASTLLMTQQLEAAGLGNARQKAAILVQLHAQPLLPVCLPLLQHPECDLILDTASSMATIIGSTHNINMAVDRVAKLVLALKSFSRVDQKAERIQARLSDGIETVLMIYHGQIKQGVDVVREYEEIPPIFCLPDELNQVWTNLIHNALFAMNYEGVLTVRIRQENNEAVVSVGDTGCGIPEAVQAKIFDAFFTTKSVGEGSGLGLDIVKKIIEKHQGRITVQSQVGVGTTFFVYLPYGARDN